MEYFKILGIEPTEDKDKIKQAYRDKLPDYHPEEDPEGFGRLRQAYEEALNYKEEEKVEDNPELSAWIEKVNGVYSDFGKRMDLEQWQELLEDDVCFSLDSAGQANIRLLSYLMDHYYIPHKVWKLLESHFAWEEKRMDLINEFPKRFVDYVCANAKYEDEFRYELFQIEEGKPYEEFIRNYFYLINNFSNDEAADREEKTEENIASGIEHPDFTILLIRYALKDKDLKLANEQKDILLRQRPDDVKSWYLAALVESENDNFDRALELSNKVLESNKEHVGAMIVMGDTYMKQERYEQALQEYTKALDGAPYYGYIHNSLHNANTALAKEYTDKYGERPDDPSVRLKLVRYRLKSNQIEELTDLFESIETQDIDLYEYHKLGGEMYAHLGDFPTAYEYFERALELCEGDSKELAGLYAECGLQLLDMERYDEAIEKYDKGLTIDPESYRLAYRKAAALTKLKRYQEAVKLCDEILAKEAVPNAYHFRAEAYYEMGEYEKALEDCKAAVGMVPYYVTYIMQLDIYHELRRPEDMNALVDYMLSIGFTGSQIMLYKVRAFINLERYEEAKTILDGILSEEPDNAEAWYRYALTSWYIGTAEEALAAIEKSEGKVLDADGQQFLKASILIKLKRFKEAKSLYSNMMKDESCTSKDYIYTRLGYIAEIEEQYQEAIGYYEKCLEISPDYNYINGKIADCYENLKQYEKALIYNKKDLQSNPDSYLYHQRGGLYWVLGKKEQSKECYEKALEYDPKDSYAYNSLGIYYMEMKEVQKAIEYFKGAVELKHPNVWAYLNLSKCLRRQKQYSEAMDALSLGWENCKREPIILFRKASLYKRMKQYERAVQCYGEYYSDPEDQMWKYIKIASCYTQMHKPKEAIKYLKLAKKNSKDCFEPYEELGSVYENELKKYKKAVKYYQKALELDGKQANLYVSIGDCLRKMGREQDAMNYYNQAVPIYQEKIKSENNKPCLYKEMGRLYLGLLQFEKAIEYFNKAVEKAPAYRSCHNLECHEAIFGIGQAYEALGNYGEAQKNYEQALDIVDNDDYLEALNRIKLRN